MNKMIQPSIVHQRPEDYGMSELEAAKIRLRYLRDRQKQLDMKLALWGKHLLEAREEDKWFIYDEIDNCICLKKKYEKNISFIIKLERSIKDKKPKPESIDLALIRDIPIKTVLDNLGYRPNANGWYNCPFHKEKTPSFHVMPNNNKFKCFSCGESGTTIDLVMKINNCSVSESIKYLKNYL